MAEPKKKLVPKKLLNTTEQNKQISEKSDKGLNFFKKIRNKINNNVDKIYKENPDVHPYTGAPFWSPSKKNFIKNGSKLIKRIQKRNVNT